jgi:hypothetical protein
MPEIRYSLGVMTDSLRYGAAAVFLLLGFAAATAQIVGPGGAPLAPGPSLPRDFTPGGAGPGGAQIAPGSAARGLSIDHPGPGGTRLAPGPAGTSLSQPVRRPRRLRAPPEKAEVAVKEESRAKAVKSNQKKRHVKKTSRRAPAKTKRGR